MTVTPGPKTTAPETIDLGPQNAAFHRALRKFPDAFEALHFFWNEAIAGVPQCDVLTSDSNPSQNAVTGSSGTHPATEGAADKAPPAIQCGVQTSETVNAAASLIAQKIQKLNWRRDECRLKGQAVHVSNLTEQIETWGGHLAALRAVAPAPAQAATESDPAALRSPMPNIVKELADFFLDELKRDRAGTEDWVAQGSTDVEEFIAAVKKLSTSTAPPAEREAK